MLHPQLGAVDAGEKRLVETQKVDSSGLRHTSIKRAMKHSVKAPLVKQLGRIKPVLLFVFGEEELCDSHALDQMHGPMAARALP